MKLSLEKTINLCDMIQEFGFTNREFAMKLGITDEEMSKIESGHYNYNDQDLEIIANLFETDEFYYED